MARSSGKNGYDFHRLEALGFYRAWVGKLRRGGTRQLPKLSLRTLHIAGCSSTRTRLNTARAAEEAQGNIRWLRPEFQCPESVEVRAEFPSTDSPGAIAPESPTTNAPAKIVSRGSMGYTLRNNFGDAQ